MAKRDDDDLDPDEVDEAVEDAEEAEAADSDEAVEADVDDAEDAETADEADAEDETPAEEEKPRPKPKITGLTLTLCILNVLAALGFVFLLMLNYEKRQQYTFAATSREFELVGVGTVEDKEGDTAGTATMPKVKLSNEALREALSKRGVGSVSEPFTPSEEGLKFHFYAGDVTPDILRELMSDLGDPVGSIEEEMRRLKGRLPGDIQAVAKEIATSMQKATDAQKQQRIGMLLYPLCLDPYQIEKLEAKIKKTPGSELDKMLEEAVERRILADILLPV